MKPVNPIRQSVVIGGALIVAAALWFVESHPAPTPLPTADPDAASVPVLRGRTPEMNLTTESQVRSDAAVRARAKRLLGAARHLYDEAEAVVAKAPRTGIDAAHLASRKNAGGRFYAAERAYESAIARGPSVDLIADPQLQRAILNLGEYGGVIYSTVSNELSTCDVRSARADLGIAKAYLTEIPRELAGSGSDDWQPPDRTDDLADPAHCS